MPNNKQQQEQQHAALMEGLKKTLETPTNFDQIESSLEHMARSLAAAAEVSQSHSSSRHRHGLAAGSRSSFTTTRWSSSDETTTTHTTTTTTHHHHHDATTSSSIRAFDALKQDLENFAVRGATTATSYSKSCNSNNYPAKTSSRFIPPPPYTTIPPSSSNSLNSNSSNKSIEKNDELIRKMEELEQYVERGLKGALAVERGDANAPSEESIGELQLQTARKLRELLSTNRDLVHTIVKERNWIPLLLGWLRLHDRPAVQAEALRALTNITGVMSGSTGGESLSSALERKHKSMTASSPLLKHDAVPVLISLLKSNCQEVREQAMWILGSLGGESSAARDAVLSKNAMEGILECIDANPRLLSLQRISSWALSNLVKGQPRQQGVDISVLIPYLWTLLNFADAEVLSHTCWALSHLCDGPVSNIAVVVENKQLIPKLIELLSHGSWRVTKPALRCIGNIVCAEDDNDYTEVIIDLEAVPHLKKLITHPNKEIQKEACWTISNIAAGTQSQIQAVIDCGAIPLVAAIAMSDSVEPEVKSEACWVVLNASSCGSDNQIELLIKEGCVVVLEDLLEEASMVMMALEGLERVLHVEERKAFTASKNNEPLESPLVTAGMIERLQKHKSGAIVKKANKIWKQYFVSCALCDESFSKHVLTKVKFCKECKCHVCCNCSCEKYHLSYQEAMWADDDNSKLTKNKAVDNNGTSTKSKKSKKKNKKKKGKKDETSKISNQDGSTNPEMPPSAVQSRSNSFTEELTEDSNVVSSSTFIVSSSGALQQQQHIDNKVSTITTDAHPTNVHPVQSFKQGPNYSGLVPSESKFDNGQTDYCSYGNDIDGLIKDRQRSGSPIDFVLYLQQTGSILALAKLMDALDNCEEEVEYEYGSDMDEIHAELQLLSKERLEMKT